MCDGALLKSEGKLLRMMLRYLLTDVLGPLSSVLAGEDVFERFALIGQQASESDEPNHTSRFVVLLTLLLAEVAGHFRGYESAISVPKDKDIVAIAAQIEEELVDQAAVIIVAGRAVALCVSSQELWASDWIAKSYQRVSEGRIVGWCVPCIMNQDDHWQKLGKVLVKAHTNFGVGNSAVFKSGVSKVV
jgi:hypothetical protein